MNPTTPISCALHDHLEIACLFGYRLVIETRDGRKRIGRAVDTRTVSGATEYLIVATNTGPLEIRMHEIAQLTVLTAKARFRHLKFINPGDPR